MHKGAFTTFAGVSLSIFVLLCSVPASAVERTAGESYTYELNTEVSGIQVTGELTYEFEGSDVVSLEGTDYDVNVMRISGELTGGIMMVDLVTATVDGRAYETKDGVAVVKEETTVFANLTFGTGQFAQVRTLVEEISSTHAPPLLSGFDPSATELGDQWSETIMVRAMNATWLNGELWGDPVWTNQTIQYNVSVGSSIEEVATEAGTFECMKLTVANETGESMVYWWSSKVGNFVRIFTYPEGETQPRETIELTDYSHGEPSNTLLIVAIGGGVLALSIVVLIIVLVIMRRKPPEPEVQEPPQLLNPP